MHARPIPLISRLPNLNQLGMVHLERTRGDRPENLANAIESFQKCLEVYTEASNPLERAEVQEKLSIAYQEVRSNPPPDTRNRKRKRISCVVLCDAPQEQHLPGTGW